MRFKWNRNALYQIRTMAQPLVDEHLSRLARAAGPGFEWESHQGRKAPYGRWRGTVYPATYQARIANARNNILVRVLGGGA